MEQIEVAALSELKGQLCWLIVISMGRKIPNRLKLSDIVNSSKELLKAFCFPILAYGSCLLFN